MTRLQVQSFTYYLAVHNKQEAWRVPLRTLVSYGRVQELPFIFYLN